MFSQNKKPDSKIRFQHQTFKRQLEQARNYKRPIKKFPKNNWEAFFERFGLGSIWTKLFVIFVLLVVIYIIYIPNFLWVKNVEISGLNNETSQEAKNSANIFLNSKALWPQKNLLLLSTKNLGNFLLATQTKVLKVNSIQKKYPNTLVIKLQPRINSYLVSIPGSNYTISDDGVVINKLAEINTTTSSSLISIKLLEGNSLNLGEKLLSPELLNVTTVFNNNLSEISGSSVNYFELKNLTEPDITIYTSSDYKILTDTKSNPSEVLSYLKVLLGQVAPGDLKRLYYIDMRIKNKAYVCYKDTPCVKDIIFNMPPAATSTASSTKE